VIGAHDIDNGSRGTNLKAKFLEPEGQAQSDVGLTAAVAPAGHHHAYEFFELRASRRRTPSGIIEILVKNHYAVRRERGSYPRENRPGILHEGKNPATPSPVGHYSRKLIGLKIGGMCGDVANVALATCRIESTKKSFGLVNRHHAPGRTEHLGEIQRCVTRPTAHIQHYLTRPYPGRVPGFLRMQPPRAMLQTKPLDLLIMGSQYVVFRGCHSSLTRRVRRLMRMYRCAIFRLYPFLAVKHPN